jgi:hypothetical protein
MGKRRMLLAACTATLLLAGCARPASSNTDEPEPPDPANQEGLPIVTDGYGLSLYVGKRVQVVGRFHQRRGQGIAKPPPSHPVVNMMDVGPKAVFAYTRAPLEDRVANCEVIVIATVLERRGPVKDGGSSGRIYEPVRQFDLQVEEISDCPEPEPLVFVSELGMQLDGCMLVPERRVEWVKYSETLQPDSVAVLDDVAELMRRNPTLTLRIGVHIESKGSEKHNLALTERRAKVIAEHLSAAGIDAQRFTVRGYGESTPIDDGPRELQTRVELLRTDHPNCR